MVRRTTKAKKEVDVQMAETEAPKKGRGKAKQVEIAEAEPSEPEISEKPAPEKKKRGRKAVETNGQQEVNEVSEQKQQVAKRGNKKTAPQVNGNSDEAGSPASEEAEQNDENIISNGNTELVANGKGKRKPAKKETEKPTKAKKPKKESNSHENGVDYEKPKAAAKGRKVKTEKETEEKTENGDDLKTVPASKGRKKTPAKSTPEPQVDKEEDLAPKSRKKGPAKTESQEDKIEVDQKEIADKPEEKKATKGKKPTGKKAQTKGELEENALDNETSGKKKKAAKKEEKGQGDAIDEAPLEEKASEAKPKGKKAQKKVVEALKDSEEESEDTGEPSSKRRRKAEDNAPAEGGKAKAPAKNKASTDYESIDFSNVSKNALGKEWNFKIASWNVDGLRAWMKKGGLDYIKFEKPDILCLQETKCSQDKLPEEAANLPGYHAYWLSSDKDGYAGVGIYTTKLAISVQYGLQNEALDSEGRIITAEYEEFYLICTYVINAGRGLVTLDKRLQWNEEFRRHVKELDKKKPVIICGDMNVAHNEIDLKNPKTNRKNAGFTDEERAGMSQLLSDGFVDTYRHLNPDTTGAYTFWTYMMNSRAKNTGWRLDYFIVSERLMPSICDNTIRDQVYGSDHCPIALFLHLTSAEQPKE